MAKLDFIVWLKTNHCIQWNSFGSKAKQKRIGLLYFLPYSIEGMSQTVCGLVMCSTNPTTMGFQTTLPSSVHPLRWTPNSLMRPSYRSPPSIRRFCGGLPQCPRGGTPEPTHSQNAKKDQIFIFFRSTVAATTRKKFLPPAPPWFTVRNTCTGVRTPRRLDRDWI